MRSVEIFAGCGGLALGVAKAGFDHDLVVEMDGDSVKTLRDNKKRKVSLVRDWEIGQFDTRDLDFSDLGGIDLLSGGPPCQPFSIGGRHLGPRDSRNMWPEAVRAVQEIRPKAFIFENVRGLFRPAFASYLEYIKLQLSFPDLVRGKQSWRSHLVQLRARAKSGERGQKYRVVAQAINAADYGAPQKRHRAIIMGVSMEHGDTWSFPSPTHSHEALAWSKHVEQDYWERHGTRRSHQPSSAAEASALRRVLDLKKKPSELPWVTVRDAIDDLPTPTKSEKISGHWQHPGACAYPNHTGSCLDEPAKALKAGDHGVPGGENMLAGPRGGVRYFTIREMARLQCFPDEFEISGSWKSATRQLGNAVPTVVGEYMASAVFDILKKKRPRRREN